MMERNLEVLENNQKSIGEIISNVMNQGGTGVDSSANVK